MRRFTASVIALVLWSAARAEPHAGSDDEVVKRNEEIMARMRKLEAHLAEKTMDATSSGQLLVNGPLPADFAARFSESVAKATGADVSMVKFLSSANVQDAPGVMKIAYKAPPEVVKAVEDEAGDPDSDLAKGNLHSFLVAKEDDGKEAKEGKGEKGKEPKEDKASASPASAPEHEVTPVQEKGIDIDTQMPYGDLEPFGREDTAQELTESAVKESDEMVDQLERAEVAEEKRSVFRALTRLRGAAITSFDGVARSQTGNIDEYNKVHKWRKTHPLHHLADEESDVSKWAFPDNADLLQKSQ